MCAMFASKDHILWYASFVQICCHSSKCSNKLKNFHFFAQVFTINHLIWIELTDLMFWGRRRRKMTKKQHNRISKVETICCVQNWILMYYEIQSCNSSEVCDKSDKQRSISNSKSGPVSRAREREREYLYILSQQKFHRFAYTKWTQSIYIRVHNTALDVCETSLLNLWDDVQFHSFIFLSFDYNCL